MSPLDGQQIAMPSTSHKVTWFPPDRPVEGNTIYVRPGASSGDPVEGVNSDE
jgi:hypothetical protein